MSVLGPPDSSIRAVNDEIVRAYAATRNSRANFLLVLIPSRATITLGPTGESDAYDLYMKIFERYDMPVLDLRDVFLRQDDPASLYYEIDAHWNARGIAIAAEAILEGMRRIEEANTR